MELFGPKLDALVRHVLSGPAALLVAWGASPEAVSALVGSTSAVVGGVAFFGISLGWSLLEKSVRK